MGNKFCLGYSPDSEVLMVYVAAGNHGRIKQLIRHRPELIGARKGLSKGSTSVWHCAAKTGSISTLRLLYDEALDIYRSLPVEERKTKVQRLLDIGNRRGHTPLHVACLHGHVEVVSFLVSTMGADAFLVDQHGSTALHFAAFAGHANCIRAIMDNVHDLSATRGRHRLPELPNNAGLTPLHYAAACDHLDCAQALLERNLYLIPRTKIFSVELGLNISAGSTPLHVAASRGSLPMSRLLLKHQASSQSVNPLVSLDMRWVKNSERFTPCMEALRAGHSDELVELLDPRTDLRGAFDLQDLTETAAGVPKLSILAAAALQSKLITDLKRTSELSGLCTPTPDGDANFSPRTSYMEDVGDAGRSSDADPGASAAGRRSSYRASAQSSGAAGRRSLTVLGTYPEEGQGHMEAGDEEAMEMEAYGRGGDCEPWACSAPAPAPSAMRRSGSAAAAAGSGVLSAAVLLLSRAALRGGRTGPSAASRRGGATAAAGTSSAMLPEAPSRLQQASSSQPAPAPAPTPAPTPSSSSLALPSGQAPSEDRSSDTRSLESAMSAGDLHAWLPAAVDGADASQLLGSGIMQNNLVFADGRGAEPGPESSALLLPASPQSEEDSGLCGLCFDRSADVDVGGCSHTLCSNCAQQLCARLTDKPLACPSSVTGFSVGGAGAGAKAPACAV